MNKNLQNTLSVPSKLVREIEAKLLKNPRAFKDLGLHHEYIYFICDSIIQRMSHSIKDVRDRIEKNKELSDYYTLHSGILAQVCQSYKAHTEFMEENGIIQCDGYWVVGQKSLGYRFSQDHISGIEEVEITKFTLKMGLLRRTLKWIEERKVENKGYNYLTKWIETDKLSIDWVRAKESIKEKKNQLLAGNEENKESKIQFYTHLQYAAAKRFDNEFTAKDYNFDKKGHRLYSPLTNLPKALRGCLLYDGKPLVGVDIKNSQPYLLSILFKESFWANYFRGDVKTKKTLKFRKLSIYKILEEVNINNIINSIKTFETLYGSDLQKVDFFNLVFEGGLYKYIESHFKDYYPEDFIDEKVTKQQVLKILYSNDKIHFLECYEPCKLFNEFFPGIYPVINSIKSNNYKNISWILQNIESYLMIDVICKRINKLYPFLPIYTVHDSILTISGYEHLVHEIVQEELENYVGVKPKLKYEYPYSFEKQEIWKDIRGYEGSYVVNPNGEIKSIARNVAHRTGIRTVKEYVLSSRIDNHGYETVRLSKNGEEKTHYVHRLIAEAFISNVFNYPQVNHKNGVKTDNQLENLEWVTASQNTLHAYRTGLVGEKKNCVEIINSCTGETFPSIKEAAVYHFINYSTCKNYLNGHRPNPTCLRYKEKLKVA